MARSTVEKEYSVRLTYTVKLRALSDGEAIRKGVESIQYGADYTDILSYRNLTAQVTSAAIPVQAEVVQPPAVEGEIEPVPFAPTPNTDALDAVERVTARPVELSCEEASPVPVTAAADIPF